MSEVIAFCQAEGCDTQVTEKVANYSKEHYDGAIFCYECQKKLKKTESPQPKTASKYEDDIVNFETLLNDAHEKHGKNLKIITELVDKNMQDKWAVFKATVLVNDQMFEAHGDATQDNCSSSMIRPHFLRMAETRAIARALRWATNNAATAEEEKA